MGIFRIYKPLGNIFYVNNNDSLTALGDFSVLQSIGGDFYVNNNDKLTDLGDFSVLQSIGGSFIARSNARLTTLGDFPVLQTVGGYFEVYANSNLTTLGDFSVLQSIGGDFYVQNNDKLTDLGDFPALDSIGGFFDVFGNNQLTTLGDFPDLQTIGSYFVVEINARLTTLGNFSNLTSIGRGYVSDLGRNNISIWIAGNSSLSDCYVLTEFLPGGAHAVSGEIYINDNAVGCNSGDEIMASAPHTIILTSHTDGDSIAIAYDEVTTQTIMFSIGGGATGWTSAITGDDFITLDTDMNVAQDTGVAITVRATPTENTGVARSATIRITTMGGTGTVDTARVTITQAAAPPSLVISSGATVTLAHDASTAQIITFTVGGSATGWASSMSGDNFIFLSDDGNETGAVVVIATPSVNTGVERSAVITFTTSGGVGDAVTATVTITQAAAPPSLVLSSPSTITLGYDASMAQTITFTVGGSASGWASSMSGGNFITLSDDGNETGDVTVTATPTENTGVARSATISITTMGGTGAAATFTVTIRQEAAPPSLVLSSGATVTLAHDVVAAQTITFTVGGSASGWASSMSGGNFITLSDDGNETGDVTVTATPTENTGVARSAVITFTTSGGVGDAATVTVTITQDGSPPTIRLISKNRETFAYDETTETAIMFEVGGGATAWWAGVIDGDSDNNFVMLDKTSGSAGLDTIKVTTAENTGEARVDTVVVGTGGEGEATDTIIVTQEAIPTIVVTDPSDGMITINHDVVDAQFITFDVGGSATGWVASSYQSFVTLAPASGNVVGMGIHVMATFTEENRDVERTATITITTVGQLGEARTATVTITQLEPPSSPILKITPPSGVSDTVAYTATTTSDSVEIVFTSRKCFGLGKYDFLWNWSGRVHYFIRYR